MTQEYKNEMKASEGFHRSAKTAAYVKYLTAKTRKEKQEASAEMDLHDNKLSFIASL